MRKVIPILAAALLTAALAGSASASNAVSFQIGLTGSQERPVAGDPDAAGIGEVAINPASDLVCFKLEWVDIDGTVVAAHIHGPADRNTAASPIVTFFSGASFEGTDKANGCTHSAAWADEIAGDPENFYVNVHSTVFPPGAIRGQLQ